MTSIQYLPDWIDSHILPLVCLLKQGFPGCSLSHLLGEYEFNGAPNRGLCIEWVRKPDMNVGVGYIPLITV